MKKENMSDAQVIRRLKVNESVFFPLYRYNSIRQRVREENFRFGKERQYKSSVMKEEGYVKVTRLR